MKNFKQLLATELDFYEITWTFLIYSFLGWCMESAFITLSSGNLTNTGFLNGTVCPIYGFGAVIIIQCLSPFVNNIVVLFFASGILTSILEFITGYTFNLIFQQRWWDYSNMPFNFHGYVCLKYSLYWGAICVFLIKFLHPITHRSVQKIPKKVGQIISTLILIIMSMDFAVTIFSFV